MQADAATNTASADFRHTRDGAGCMSRCWAAAAQGRDVSPGARAYAYQQAAMYARIMKECQKTYDITRAEGTDGEALDHSMVSCPTSLVCFHPLT